MTKPTFTFENCKVVRVIDADTVELSVDLGFRTWHTDKFRRNQRGGTESGTRARGQGLRRQLVIGN